MPKRSWKQGDCSSHSCHRHYFHYFRSVLNEHQIGFIMIKEVTGSLKLWFYNPKYRHFLEVFWFAIITLSIHYGYRFWANSLHYSPIKGVMNNLQLVLTQWVFDQSVWINRNILGISMQLGDKIMNFDNGSWIKLNYSCSGDKQILQFALLILIYPGLWKRKIWFIPLGMIIIHFTNVLRIVLLSVVSINRPEYWHLAHNTVLRAMFYVVILALWIIWVEKINKPGFKPNESSGSSV